MDGRRLSFFTSAEGLGLPERALQIAAAHAALANLIDLNSIVLPHHVVIEGIHLSQEALQFWQRTARGIGAERLVQDDLPARVLDAKWTSRGHISGRMESLPRTARRKHLLAMSGGKESLAALKLAEDRRRPSLFFLHYPDSGWHHGERLFRFFQRTHDCVKVRTDITGTGPLLAEFNCSGYGMFVIGQIVFSALLLMDQFSSVVIGNEYSANFGNGTFDGIPVNHQYDKAFRFARDLNNYLARHVTDEFTHTSPFWRWHEYRISKAFFSDDRWLRQWSSCNNSSAARLFCGACAKCAFVFLMGAAHTDPIKIRRIMKSNMLDDIELIRSLADDSLRKPLECVGTREETWVALEDIWQKDVWRDSSGLQYYAEHIRPRIVRRLPALRQQLLRDQSLREFGRIG